uniref:MH2 domain-containing protein n=1 Tax=Macrostomum lignano TaxID=282301 RepID=A0A1I8J4D9_9PLAT
LVPEKQQRQAVASLLHWLASCYQLDEATLTETAGQLSSLSDGQLRDLLAAATAANEVCLDSVPPSIPTSSCCIPLPINLKPRLLVCRLRRWTDLDDNSEELLRVCRCSVENGNANAPIPCTTLAGSGARLSITNWNNRVGDAFKASEPCLRIDGGGGGSFDRVGRRRFCLAPLWNADRPAAAHAVRRCIGQGLLLQLCRGGTVYLQCRSPVPVFVQSPNASLQRGWHPATVCRVPPAAACACSPTSSSSSTCPTVGALKMPTA